MKTRTRLIDEIWTELREKYVTDVDMTHLSLSKSSYHELLVDYNEEFDVSGTTLRELEDYLGLKILINPNGNGERFQFLKML